MMNGGVPPSTLLPKQVVYLDLEHRNSSEIAARSDVHFTADIMLCLFVVQISRLAAPRVRQGHYRIGCQIRVGCCDNSCGDSALTDHKVLYAIYGVDNSAFPLD